MYQLYEINDDWLIAPGIEPRSSYTHAPRADASTTYWADQTDNIAGTEYQKLEVYPQQRLFLVDRLWQVL